MAPLQRHLRSETQVGIGSIPNVDLNTGRGAALLRVGEFFMRAQSIAMEDFKDELRIEGKKQGTIVDERAKLAGIDIPIITRAEGNDPFINAFNRAQQASYSARIETVVRNKVSEVSTKFRNGGIDPTTGAPVSAPIAMQSAMEAFTRGIEQAVPAELRGAFRAETQKMMLPHIADAWKRLHKAQVADQKQSLDDLETLHLMGYFEAGRFAANGSDAGREALTNASTAYMSFMAQLRARMNPMTFGRGAAAKRATLYSSAAAREMIKGIFVGANAAKRDEVYQKMRDGTFTIEFPMAKSGGQGFEIREVRVSEVLIEEDRKEARAFMRELIGETFTVEQRSRAASERNGKEQASADMRLAISGDATAMGRMFSNIYATDAQVREVRRWAIEGVTDPEYYVLAERAILAGELSDMQMLEPAKLSRVDRDYLVKKIDERQKGDHYSRDPRFTSAIKLINTDIAELIGNSLAVGKKQKGSNQRRLAASMGAALQIVAEGITRPKAGQMPGRIGKNTGSHSVEVVAATDPRTGQPSFFERFDPELWVINEISKLNKRADASSKLVITLTAEREKLKVEIKKLQAAKAIVPTEMFDRQAAFHFTLRSARLEARAALVFEGPER